MPQKVEKNYYDQYIYPILKSEFRDDKSAANIQLVGKYFSFRFSNSVTAKLITYN